MDEVIEELKDSQEAPKEKLLRFCQNYSELMLTYPGFLKAQISQYILEEGTWPEVEEWIGRSFCRCWGKRIVYLIVIVRCMREER